MTNKLLIIWMHLYWIKKGYSFEYIHSIYDEISADPFSDFGVYDIQKHIGGKASQPEEEMSLSDFEKISYIVIGKCEFDGNLSFLKRCINIEHIFIDLCSSDNHKIENIKPLANFKKLKSLSLVNHNISDISSIVDIETLENIDFFRNPITTIKPIVHFKKLKYARFAKVEDAEVFELLNNSNNATIDYYSKEIDQHFIGFWLKDWAFITTQYVESSTIYISIGPLLPIFFEEKLKTSNIDYISLMKNKSKDIAYSLLKDNQEIIGNTDYIYEDVKFVKGKFDFRTKV